MFLVIHGLFQKKRQQHLKRQNNQQTPLGSESFIVHLHHNNHNMEKIILKRVNKTTFANSERIGVTNFIQGQKGNFRAIVKCPAGFMTVSDCRGAKSAIDAFRCFQQKGLQTIEFQPKGYDTWFTVFARKGKKIICMDEEMFMTMKVGDINQQWSDTNLYSQNNYRIAGAATWEDFAFKIK